MTLAQAIARVEGWYNHGDVPNRCQRNNNPGNLEYNKFTESMGAIGTDGRFAKFENSDHGWIALYTLLIVRYSTMAISAMIREYAPSTENDTQNYINMVCSFCDKQPSDLVGPCLL